jgi:hypothetical protein
MNKEKSRKSKILGHVWVLLFLATGCDLGTYAQRVESAGSVYKPPVKTAAAADSGEQESSKPLPGNGSPALGDWQLNQRASVESTRRIFQPVPSQPALTLAALEDTLNSMKSTFTLNADMTFTCNEVARSRLAKYKGTWKLSRDRIELNQTHMNGRPEKDYLVGTLKGDVIDAVLEKEGVKMGVVLDRVR